MPMDRMDGLALAGTPALSRAQREPGTDQWQPRRQRVTCRNLMGRTGDTVCGAQLEVKMQGPLLKNQNNSRQQSIK